MVAASFAATCLDVASVGTAARRCIIPKTLAQTASYSGTQNAMPSSVQRGIGRSPVIALST